jgi:hypothetical protein
MSANTASGPVDDYSNDSRALTAAFAASVVGAVLLLAADLTTLVELRVGTVTRERLSGHAQHDWAVALLGVAALVLAIGALARRSRAALTAVTLVGLVVVIIALVADLPDTHATGVLGQQYEEAHAAPGPGFYLEVGGGALLLVAGGGGIALGAAPVRRGSSPDAERERRRAARAAATEEGG